MHNFKISVVGQQLLRRTEALSHAQDGAVVRLLGNSNGVGRARPKHSTPKLPV